MKKQLKAAQFSWFSQDSLVNHTLRFCDDPYDLVVWQRVSKTFNRVISSLIVAYGNEVFGEDLTLSQTMEFLKNNPITLSNFSLRVTFRNHSQWNFRFKLGPSVTRFMRVVARGVDPSQMVQQLEPFQYDNEFAQFHFVFKRFQKCKYRCLPVQIWCDLPNNKLSLSCPLALKENNLFNVMQVHKPHNENNLYATVKNNSMTQLRFNFLLPELVRLFASEK